MPRRRYVPYPPDSVTSQLGPRLRRARRARGLTQAELARLAGVSKGTVGTAENAVTGISLSVAYAIARALGTTISALTGELE